MCLLSLPWLKKMVPENGLWKCSQKMVPENDPRKWPTVLTGVLQALLIGLCTQGLIKTLGSMVILMKIRSFLILVNMTSFAQYMTKSSSFYWFDSILSVFKYRSGQNTHQNLLKTVYKHVNFTIFGITKNSQKVPKQCIIAQKQANLCQQIFSWW